MCIRDRFDGSQFVFWQELTASIVDTGRFGDGIRCGSVVPSQHDRRNAKRMQLLYGLARTLFDGVGHCKDCEHLGSRGKHGDCPALCLMDRQSGFNLRPTNTSVFNQPVVAEHEVNAIDLGLDSPPRQRCKALGLPIAFDG